jgi:hypothetical protein
LARRQGGVVIVLVYVDDLLVISKSKGQVEATVDLLASKFAIKRMGEPKKFVGLEVSRDRTTKTVSFRQSLYARDILERFEMGKAKPIATPMEEGTRLEPAYSNEEW